MKALKEEGAGNQKVDWKKGAGGLSQFITIIDGRVINSEPKTVNKCHLLGDWSYKIFFQAAESEQYVLVETVHTWKISLIRACIQVLKRVKWGGGCTYALISLSVS